MTSVVDAYLDTSESPFLEFGHGPPPVSQAQLSPVLAHGHYPLHGFHPNGHDALFPPGASPYGGRALPYPYSTSAAGQYHPCNGSSYLNYQHYNAAPDHGGKSHEDPETEKATVIENGEIRINGKGKKIRKPRTIYSSLQLQALNQRFQQTQYLALPERAELAAQLGLTQTQVKIWFQNKRSKYKKVVKQGSTSEERDHSHNSSPLSPCSPSGPPLWDFPPAAKTVPVPSSYVNNFNPWCQSPESLPRLPMI
ncbi:homeobox protein DLX-4 [Gastrophryne carolinensis]